MLLLLQTHVNDLQHLTFLLRVAKEQLNGNPDSTTYSYLFEFS